MDMRRVRSFHLSLALAMLVCIASSSWALGQCAIQPIKPIPPLGCKDLTPQCVADNSGHAYWTWACVSDRDETNKINIDRWKPISPAPRPQPIPIPIPTPTPNPAPPLSAPLATSTAPPPDILWVKVGMLQQEVLSRLAGRFKLTKEDIGEETGSKMDIWSVESLSPSLGFCEIVFVDGKVGSILTHSAPLLQGEVLVLAQRLFADLYARGDADNSKVGKFLGTRDLTVQVKMFQMTSEGGNEETVRFQFDNGRTFEIKINVPVKGSPAVNTSEFQTQ